MLFEQLLTSISSTTISANVGSAFCTFSVTASVKEEESIDEIWPAVPLPPPALTVTSYSTTRAVAGGSGGART